MHIAQVGNRFRLLYIIIHYCNSALILKQIVVCFFHNFPFSWQKIVVVIKNSSNYKSTRTSDDLYQPLLKQPLEQDDVKI